MGFEVVWGDEEDEESDRVVGFALDRPFSEQGVKAPSVTNGSRQGSAGGSA